MISFGPFSLAPIQTGTFKLDGGAMFGVVPKTLWSKFIPADENNRIPMGMRCLLVKSDQTGKIYLIDCGLGEKFDAKQREIYQYDSSVYSLESSLRNEGVTFDDITDLVLTHLHFDHAGGATAMENGTPVNLFKNATFHVTASHWETALRPNQREKASFFSENILPLKESGRLKLWNEPIVYEPGFDALVMNGHTIGQQLPRLTDGHKTLIFAGDLLPTYAHVPLPWVMGYDMQPLVTLQEKEAFLNAYSNPETFVFLEHDASHEVINLAKKDGKFTVASKLTLQEAVSL